MMLAAILLLPRILTGADPAGAVKLSAPHVEMRINEASATRSPWIDANGWQILRTPGRTFVYHVTGDAAALAAAESFTYGVDALVAADARGVQAFNRMLDFLRAIPAVTLAPVADVAIIDDGTDESGELMNLMTRHNLLYKVVKSPDKSLRLNVRLGTKDYPAEISSDPYKLAQVIRGRLGDQNRSLRIYGSEVVIAHLAASDGHARVYLLNYAGRPVRGLRVRVYGAYSKGEPRLFGVATPRIEDWTRDGDFTEFTVPELNAFGVIDLTR